MRFQLWIALLLLVIQPVLFFRRVLINPDRHIPYDLLGFHTPLADFIAYALRQGELPLWDPHPYCGYPIHADIQAQLFYPPAWLAIAARNFGSPGTMFYWLEWLVTLHMMLAGLLTFWLARRLGCGVPAALLGGTAFQLGAFFASQSQHLGAVSAAAWMPLAWLACWELRGGFRVRWFALLSMALALSLLAGFSAMTLVVWASALVVGWRRFWLVLAACAAAVPLVLVQLLPTLWLTPSTAASLRPDWNTGVGTPLRALWSLVIPNYHGVFTPFDAGKFTGDYEFTFLYCYCGAATLVLAVAALGRGSRRARWFALAALGFFALQSGSFLPGFATVFAWMPRLVRGTVYMNFFLGAACLALAVAAALMLERAGSRWAWALSVLTAGDLLLMGADRPMNSHERSWKNVTSETTVDGSTRIAQRVSGLVGESTPPWRVDVMDLNFSFTMNASWRRVPTPNGDNPFAPLRLLELRRQFASGNWWERQLPVVKPDSALLDFLNVRYLLAYSVKEDAGALARAGWTAMERLEDGTRVYRNEEVMPRLFLSESVGVAPKASSSGAVRVVRYGLNEVVVETEAAGASVLVSSESHHPDWRVWVDGRASALLRVSDAFRGVAVGAGKHRVAMRYAPSGLGWMLMVTVCSWAAALGAVIKSNE